MKSFSTSEAAHITGVSRATIMRLIDRDQIPHHREPGRPQHGAGVIKIDVSREQLRQLVAQYSPMSGYRQKRTRDAERKARRILADAEKKAQAVAKPTNGEATTQSEPTPLESKLGALSQWAVIPAEKRDVLIKLGAMYSASDLEVLLNL